MAACSDDAWVRPRAIVSDREPTELSGRADNGTPGLIPPISRAEQRMLKSDQLPYSQLLIDKPRPKHSESLQAKLLYVIKHRLDIPSELYSRLPGESQGQESGGRVSRGAARSRASSALLHPSVYDAMIKLQSSLSVPAQSEIARLLLDRRFLVPFITPITNEDEETGFHAQTTSLELVDTVVAHNGDNSVTACLARDCSYMRVAVVSERSEDRSGAKDWISSIFHVNSFYCLDRDYSTKSTGFAPIAELGWGFLHDKTNNTFAPVMVLHVIGDYTPFLHLIQEFADAVIADVDMDSRGFLRTKIDMKRGILLKWACGNTDQNDIREQDEPAFVVSLRCTSKTSALRISEYLLEEIELSNSNTTRVPLGSIDTLGIIGADYLGRFDFGNVLNGIDISALRSEVLILQRHFADESCLRIKQLHEMDVTKRQTLQDEIEKCQNARKVAAGKVGHHAVITLFESILSGKDAEIRVAGLLDFERWISVSCEDTADMKRSDYRAALEQYQFKDSKPNRERIDDTVEAWNLAVLGMEHLWRELSHLYAADPNNRSHLADMAAQHLLDGFSLELMDGDAAMVNMKWIQGVLNSLDSKLPGAKVQVLSVMGVQSSGKSTLLNYMFGVRLRTSVSRCTRGVSMQLLKCEDRKKYDYIILMDTEGVRAPEYVGRDDSVWRDNRMATLAVLPADATVVLTKGESTDTINEILPIVLSVHLDSELAYQHGGRLPSKLFFTFNQIDLAERSKMENIVHMLVRQLNTNASIVEETRRRALSGISGTTTDSSTAYFQSLNVDINNEDQSDVRMLGTIKAQSFAPHDIPVPEFGRRLCAFREHLHERVCEEKQWNPRSFVQFKDYLTLVWDCIQHSNFNLNFKEAFEKSNYDLLMREFSTLCQKLSSHYAESFDTICKEVRESTHASPAAAGDTVQGSLQTQDVSAIVEKYHSKMRVSILQHLSVLDLQMKKLLNDPHFTKWRTETFNNWNRMKFNQKEHWFRMVQDQINVVFLYDNFVEVYKSKLRTEANALFRSGKRNKCISHDELNQLFEKIFSRLVSEANEEHPPFHKDVQRKIYEVRTQMLNSIPQPDYEYSAQSFDDDGEGSWMDFNSVKSKLKKLAWQAFRGSSTTEKDKDEKEAQLQYEIISRVQLTISTVKRYSDKVVVDCFEMASAMLFEAEDTMAVGVCLKQKVYDLLYKVLCEELKVIQRKWDESNSVSVKFRTCEESMKTYFFALSQGYQGADFLVTTVTSWLQCNLVKGFRQDLTVYIGQQLKHRRWVSDPDVMQAHVDMSLLALIENGDYEDMMRKIQDPKDHYNQIIAALIRSEIDRTLVSFLENFVSSIQKCIVTAADKAYGAPQDRSKTFLLSLRSSLVDSLLSGSSNCLLENIPDENDENAACDSQSEAIFAKIADNSLPNVRKAALEALSVLSPVNDFSTSDLVPDVVSYIMDRGYGAVDGITPRCGEPCPMCRCPCTEYYGHEGSEFDKCHDSYHQPSGLRGCHEFTTKELDHRSCAVQVKEKRRFLREDKWIKFSDFHVIFPDWKLPVVKRPLPLREYIFMRYQDDLVRESSGCYKACTAIPSSYNHSLQEIKDQIKRLIG
ncbi:hypothetical protein FI667_g15750, partial [Globisporangium splendens]